MKRCNSCGYTKPPTEFYRDKWKPDGLTRRCKACDKARGRAAYAKKIGRAPRPWCIGLTENYCTSCGIQISPGARERCLKCHHTFVRSQSEQLWATPCEFPGCTNARGKWGRKGLCDGHYQAMFRPRRGRHHKLRLQVFERDGGLCRYCGKPVRANWHLAHLVAKAKGGQDTLENLAVSCAKCNLRDGTGRVPVQLHVSVP